MRDPGRDQVGQGPVAGSGGHPVGSPRPLKRWALPRPVVMGSSPLMFDHPAAYAARGRISLSVSYWPRGPDPQQGRLRDAVASCLTTLVSGVAQTPG